MTADPNKKTQRTFQCRDVLWDTFEQMARELECSVDYLINEAMKQYARQRQAGGQVSGRTPFPGGVRSDMPPNSPSSRQPYTAPHEPATMPPHQKRPMSVPPSRLPPPPARGSGSLPAPPPRAGISVPPPPRSMGGMAAPVSGRSVPPPIPGGMGGPSMPPVNNGMAGLAVIYNGEKVTIGKDRFVIGRGRQTSDLMLKDPNVSRQHAMVEYQNGVYFMVDMGSTNGVEYNGQRIARKQIAEGDVFRICDHDLRFTYR